MPNITMPSIYEHVSIRETSFKRILPLFSGTLFYCVITTALFRLMDGRTPTYPKEFSRCYDKKNVRSLVNLKNVRIKGSVIRFYGYGFDSIAIIYKIGHFEFKFDNNLPASFILCLLNSYKLQSLLWPNKNSQSKDIVSD